MPATKTAPGNCHPLADVVMVVVMAHVVMVVHVVFGLGLGRGAETNERDQPQQGYSDEFFNHRSLGYQTVRR